MSNLTKDQDKFWKYLKGEHPGITGQRTTGLNKLKKFFAKEGINRKLMYNLSVFPYKKN